MSYGREFDFSESHRDGSFFITDAFPDEFVHTAYDVSVLSCAVPYAHVDISSYPLIQTRLYSIVLLIDDVVQFCVNDVGNVCLYCWYCCFKKLWHCCFDEATFDEC